MFKIYLETFTLISLEAKAITTKIVDQFSLKYCIVDLIKESRISMYVYQKGVDVKPIIVYL